MSDYEADIVTWSTRQADLLKRISEGKGSNETPDWENIIDEVRDVGLSEVRAVESLLFQAMLHQLKLAAWPNATASEHWNNEIRAALVLARRRYLPSMRQRISVPEIYEVALAALPDTNDGVPAGDVPEICPFTLEALLDSVQRRDRA